MSQRAPASQPTAYFRYERAVSVPRTGQACALLDSAIYPHAAPFLKDLRLHQTEAEVTYEIPYVLTMSEPQAVDTEYVPAKNAIVHGRKVMFDLPMPQRNYTDVVLDLDARNFTGSAEVSAAGKSLGTFDLFDMSARHLARGTTLHLQETNQPLLHVVLTMKAASGSAPIALSPRVVRGANVPPSREAQALYTVSARSATLLERGGETIASFALAERVPVERVSVLMPRGYDGSFSREVRITARSEAGVNGGSEETEVLSGRISRVHLREGGREIREEQLSVPAILGANLQHAATVEVAVENGGEAPLPIAGIVLEMRQRKMCFDARATSGFALFYGDPGLRAPVYDYARRYTPVPGAAEAELGPELAIGGVRPRPEQVAAGEREPRIILMVVLLGAFGVGLLAFRSARGVLR